MVTGLGDRFQLSCLLMSTLLRTLVATLALFNTVSTVKSIVANPVLSLSDSIDKVSNLRMIAALMVAYSHRRRFHPPRSEPLFQRPCG